MRSILFYLGPIPVRAYGFMIVLGFLLGLWRATRVSKRFGIDSGRVTDTALITLLAGIVGARLLYLFLEVPHHSWSVFGDILKIWQGGLSFHGGVLAAAIAVFVYTKAKGISHLRMTDVLAPSLAIGYAFARIGCFLNGCCYGVATSLPWAVDFLDPSTGLHTGPRHPAQIYAFFASLLIFLLLTRVERWNRPEGFVFFTYIVLYSVYRFLIEFIRKGASAEVWFAGLTQAQVASVATALVFAIAMVLTHKKKANPS